MRTIVVQSFRAFDVPAWLLACMASVRAWAARRGYEYSFAGDEFLDYAGGAVLHASGSILPATDVARLVWARELLHVYERVVWVDADVFIWAELEIEGGRPARDVTPFVVQFTRELWVGNDWGWGNLRGALRVNNSFCAFTRPGGAEWLDRAIAELRQRVDDRAPGGVKELELGTEYLTARATTRDVSLRHDVANLSPRLLVDLVAGVGDRALVRQYRHLNRTPFGAANLCHSRRGDLVDGVALTDELYARALQLAPEVLS